ncbi:GMC family oxidoreductase [Corallococcus exiguus]|uniref:GMC oxidoreductase n=1 Tax=Corallococcus exiguus TaxID=83462 RepID=UPI001A8E41F1|nr:GMC oxidoreductase [Corallococcus exiguus]MBN8466734.1 GMC family oxidoreductase [Corallococcus exiguus]
MAANYKKFFAGSRNIPKGISLGYPVPGPQEASADEIAGQAFFATPNDWSTIQASAYDFIVIGTGPTGVAFIEQTLKHNPNARILVLERGGFWLPTHYQMLPLAFQAATGSPPTTYPWTRTTRMATTELEFFQAGYIPVLGGRSTYWSAWCPAPTPDLMRDWPQELIDVTLQPGFWDRARAFLHVTPMDKVHDGVYGSLQHQIDVNLRENFKRYVPSAESAFPAPIAVGNTPWKGVKFYKYSTVGTLLDLQQSQKALAAQGKGQPLTIVDHCVVNRLVHDAHGTVTALETTRGPLAVSSAKVVLAMGTIPPATLLMNSFKEALPNIGKRYTGHFMSHITARVKRSAFKDLAALEIGATYLDGKAPNGLQYHVQTSAFASANPEADESTIAHEAPDAAAVASMAQLKGSEDYVVFVCATLGEVSEKNPDNWIRMNGGTDPATNITLQLQPGVQDHHLWDVLDEATYQSIDVMAGRAGCSGSAPDVEYWVDDASGNGGRWQSERPDRKKIRLNIIVHEASPLWMGKDPATSVVGLDYRPHGVHNVYVTGGALFPTSGSWNPTLTMCGLAQDLADRLRG